MEQVKKVTRKTAMNIYQRWMTLRLDATPLEKLSYVLVNYKDFQLKKIIQGLESNTQWEAEYLSKEMLHLIKAHLRERKLNNILD